MNSSTAAPSNMLKSPTQHRKFATEKFFTRNSAVAGIDLGDYILMARDKDVGTANKLFHRFPITEFGTTFAAAVAEDNNLYEILPPGMPVKPYFDCEMEVAGITPDECTELINNFTAWLMTEIQAVFGVRLCTNDITTLDSSRADKLSYHIVIQTGICFANVADHKIFVLYLVQRFSAPIDDVERDLFATLHWMFKGDKPRRIFDEVPYSSFQNFRLVNQSKKGNAHVLRNTGDGVDVETCVRLYHGVGDRVVADIDRVPTSLTKKCDGARIKTIAAERVAAAGPRVAAPVDFVATGMTLMERDKLTYDTLRRSKKPLWLQYLYLIPNTDQSYTFYRDVGFAVSGSGGNLADYEAWTALYAHKDASKCASAGFAKFRTSGDRTYGRGFLRRYAKIAHPKFFDDGDALLDEYFAPDYSGIEIIHETCPFLSMAGTEFEHDVDRPEHIIVMDAYMGRGKTSAINRMACRYRRVLYLSPRVAFAKFMAAETDSAIYLDGDYSADRLVCSMESLHNISAVDITDNPYEFVVIDECEANLAVFSSTTLRGKQMETFDLFMRIIRSATKVVMASAFITNKTLAFVRTLGLSACAIINDTKPHARRAIQTLNFFPDMAEAVESGKKIYGVFAARSHMENALTLLQVDGIKRDDIIAYSSRVDDSVYETLDTIEESWGAAKVVLATPSITVGNSYSPDRPPDFDQVWMLAMPTCICADLFQSHMRVRHLKDDELHFGFPPKKTLTMLANMAHLDFTTLAEFDLTTAEKIATVVEMLGKLKGAPGEESARIPAWLVDSALDTLTTGYAGTHVALREIVMHNLFETALSRKYFRAMYMRFLEKCGYEIKCAVGDATDFECPASSNYYSTLPEYTNEDVAEVRDLIRRKAATSTQKLAVDRFFFDKMVDLTFGAMPCSLLFDVYLHARSRTHFMRAYAETHRVEDMWDRFNGQRPDGAEFLDTTPAKLLYIKELNAMLGIAHSWIEAPISTATVDSCIDYLSANRAGLRRCFGIRDCGGGAKRRMTRTESRKLLEGIYNNWSGVEFKGAFKAGGVVNKCAYLETVRFFTRESAKNDPVFPMRGPKVITPGTFKLETGPAGYTEVELWNKEADPLGGDIRVCLIRTADIAVVPQVPDIPHATAVLCDPADTTDTADWIRADLWGVVDGIGA